MKNIFILYIPSGNHEALVHYEDTIKSKVDQERVFKYLDLENKNKLKEIFGDKKLAIWGSRDSSANRSRFEKMRPGDDILIVEGENIKLLGKVALKTVNPALSKELWKNLKGESVEGWNLIYFIANPLEIDLPFKEFKKLFNYSLNWSLRGFTNISDDKIKDFYNQYDDLYSILLKIKKGEKIIEKGVASEEEKFDTGKQEDEEQPKKPKEISEHLKMQWKLLRLGLKTSSRVWIPRNDQAKISSNYDFKDFEHEFTSGIDVQTKYVDNIDVIWKEEFRINAAFEIEHSTAIYSGLLRFSDLQIVAPNSNYPLFIVAPFSKRNKVAEQIRRPSFKKLGTAENVKFLAYEKVEEIDNFFGDSKEGLNVDVIKSKAEELG